MTNGTSKTDRLWETWITFAGAVAGIAWTLAARPHLIQPAPEGQPASYATAINMDASGAFRLVLLAFVLPLVGAALFRLASRWLAREEARPWSRVLAIAGAVAALWVATIDPTAWGWAFAVAPIGLAAALILRRFDPLFSRRDALLIPSAILLYIASLDLMARPSLSIGVIGAVGSILAIRIAVARLGRPGLIPPGWSFLLAPLAVLFLVQPSWMDRTLGSITAAGWILITPFFVRLVLPGTPRSMLWSRRILTFLIYPIFVYCYSWSFGIHASEQMPRIDIFEDGHNLLPASEMLRGELPYRDIIPLHGLLTDGLVDYVAIRWFGDTAGHALWARWIVAATGFIAIYAVGVAATGAAEGGLLIFLLGTWTMVSGMASMRVAPALVALAFTIAAVRRHSPPRLFLAGAFIAIAGLTSLDFAAYSGFVLALAALRFGATLRDRVRAVGISILGFIAGFLPAGLAFGAMGILDNFFKVTRREVLPLAPYYSIGLGGLPAGLEEFRTFPEALGMIVHGPGWSVLLWFLAAALFATLLLRSPLRIGGRSEPVLLIAAWTVVASISWAERHHHYYTFGIAALVVIGIWILRRRGDAIRNFAAAILTLVVLVSAHPTVHYIIVTMLRTAEPRVEAGWAPWNGTPRSRGVLFQANQIPPLESLRLIDQHHLAPGETWFDFANRPLLYYLFDRNAPVRQMEVPMMQPEKRQREVARRLVEDRSIVAVLVRFGHSEIDGIPNPERTPLVWETIQREFEPAWNRDGVEMWARKSPSSP